MSSADIVLALVADAQSYVTPDPLRRRVLADLRRVVDFDGAVLVPANVAAGDDGRAQFLDHDPRCLAQFAADARYAAEFARFTAPVQRGEAVIDREVFSATERRTMASYCELLRPNHIESILCCPISFRGQKLGDVSLLRDDARRPFRRSDIARMQPLLRAAALVELALRAADAPERATAEPVDAEALSPREREVARLVARGLQNKEIARALGTSPNTVRKQTIHIFEKLRLNGRTQLALWVQRAWPDKRRY